MMTRNVVMMFSFVVRSLGGASVGGGAMLLVLENSTHDTYNDILPLFYARLGWLLRKV